MNQVVLVRCRRAFWRRAATTLLALPLTGCSFLFVDAPPAHSQWRSPQSDVSCTTSKAAPVIDTVVTGLQVARTALAAGASDADYENAPISRQADMGFGVAFSALFGASAIYGYVTTGKCKDLKGGQREDRPYQGPEPAYEAWGPPPPPAPPPPVQAPVAPPPPERVCTPGATQQCVGAGACAGGQACAADGMAWQPCQCEEAAGEDGAAPPN